MSEQAAARRMRLLEEMQHDETGRELAEVAHELQVDERTVRRDIDYLQGLLAAVRGLELRRGRLFGTRGAETRGYFADQLRHNQAVNEAIAHRIVETLSDNLAIAVTAGSTTYYVAREIRRAQIEEER